MTETACDTRAQKNGDTNAADCGWTLANSLAPHTVPPSRLGGGVGGRSVMRLAAADRACLLVRK